MAETAETTDMETRREGRRGIQFPWKLHELLDRAEKDGHEDVVSWLPNGKAFKVHKKEEFCRDIMPSYFNSSKYKTWQRSLNLWGFESFARGADKGACYHTYFVRGHPELCKKMNRVKIKGSIHDVQTSSTLKNDNTASALPMQPSAALSLQQAQENALAVLLQAKLAEQRRADSELEALLASRLRNPWLNSIPSLPQNFMGSMGALPNLGLGGANMATPFLAPPPGNRVISAIRTAAAALDVIQQNEAELLRRRAQF
eukprot:Nitzschia sp. Nitz4//scaffold36_size144017//104895//105668//NITZ4_003107-RA/size144017-processed-gene-0.274-mRNA-1//-1//CDS//3329549519//7851//frame0